MSDGIPDVDVSAVTQHVEPVPTPPGFELPEAVQAQVAAARAAAEEADG